MCVNKPANDMRGFGLLCKKTSAVTDNVGWPRLIVVKPASRLILLLLLLLLFDSIKLLLFLRGNRGINEEIISRRCLGGEQSDWYEENEDLLLRLDAVERLDGGFKHFVVGVPSFRITIVI